MSDHEHEIPGTRCILHAKQFHTYVGVAQGEHTIYYMHSP